MPKKPKAKKTGRPPGSGAKPTEAKAITRGISFTPELRSWLSEIDAERFTAAARRVLLDAMANDRRPPPENPDVNSPSAAYS